MKEIVRNISYKDLCEETNDIGFVVNLNLDEDDERVVNVPEAVKVMASKPLCVPYIKELAVKGMIKDNEVLIDSELYYQTDDLDGNIHLGVVNEGEKQLIAKWIKDNMDKVNEAEALDTLSYEEFIEEYEVK